MDGFYADVLVFCLSSFREDSEAVNSFFDFLANWQRKNSNSFVTFGRQTHAVVRIFAACANRDGTNMTCADAGFSVFMVSEYDRDRVLSDWEYACPGFSSFRFRNPKSKAASWQLPDAALIEKWLGCSLNAY
jgi:hypothetical protein